MDAIAIISYNYHLWNQVFMVSGLTLLGAVTLASSTVGAVFANNSLGPFSRMVALTEPNYTPGWAYSTVT